MNTNSVDFFSKHLPQALPEDRELIIAVWNIGNPENLGQIIRLAHNVGAKKALFVNDQVNFRDSKIKKTAGFSYDQMEWSFISVSEFHKILDKEFMLVVLETCEGSNNIFSTNLPDKTILLVGNESHGLPPEIINMCNLSVHIPMPGSCKSMNVSHAVSVAAFEWYRQKSK